MTHTEISVAAPWALSHYIPLNGYHPLYRALFDDAPDCVALHAWDNVKLHERFARDHGLRESVLELVRTAQEDPHPQGANPADAARERWLPASDRVMTLLLPGDIEVHHTAPFPSFTRPFVLHCESFLPVFMPLWQQGGGMTGNARAIRECYQRIFADPLCLGIFSHVPQTLESFSRCFAAPEIDRKLFATGIGLSSLATSRASAPGREGLERPAFLFVNSANQNPGNFALRGGHIVLRFWKALVESGKRGRLLMRCARPAEQVLKRHGVDADFVRAESGRSILWVEEYLSGDELNALMESAHFMLLPSLALHSVSIMQAMAAGAVPVVTDTLGTSVYVDDDRDGVVLKGVRTAVWHADSETGVLFDSYAHASALDDTLAAQLTRRVLALLDNFPAYERIRGEAMARARKQFSGRAFSAGFWGKVSELYELRAGQRGNRTAVSEKLAAALRDCTLRREDWARVFESPTQPLRRIDTGRHRVWELGGAFVQVREAAGMETQDWSVLAQYVNPGAPAVTFASTLRGLNGEYLQSDGARGLTASRRAVDFVSRLLSPFPALHRYASARLKLLRAFRRALIFRFSRIGSAKNNGATSDVEGAVQATQTVVHGFSGYDIVRDGDCYRAVPAPGDGVPADNAPPYTGPSPEAVMNAIRDGSARS